MRSNAKMVRTDIKHFEVIYFRGGTSNLLRIILRKSKPQTEFLWFVEVLWPTDEWNEGYCSLLSLCCCAATWSKILPHEFWIISIATRA